MPCPAGEFFQGYDPGEDGVSNDGAQADAGGVALCQVTTVNISEHDCYFVFLYLLTLNFFLFRSFYIHRSSLYLISPKNECHPNNPLRGLFKLLRRFGVAEA